MFAKIAFGEDLPVKTAGLIFSEMANLGCFSSFYSLQKSGFFKAILILGEILDG